MGHVTRIVSGCPNIGAIQRQHSDFKTYIEDGIPTGQHRFHIYITCENFARTKSAHREEYKFFNKPFGLFDWLQNSLQMPSSISTTYKDTMFIVLDPDQIVLRPFTSREFSDITTKNNPIVAVQTNPYYVKDGHPIAQLYMMGTYWMEFVNSNKQQIFDVAFNATLDDIAFDEPRQIESISLLHNWTLEDVRRNYLAGPPYILTGSDLYRIVKVWATIAVPIYEICKHDFLSEMFAYVVAAVYLNTPHNLGTNLMISNYMTANWMEGWEAVDELQPDMICPKSSYAKRLSDKEQLAFQSKLPHIIHYCQEYFHGPKYYFMKHFVSDNLMTCQHPLLLDANDYVPNAANDEEDVHLALSYASNESFFISYDKQHLRLSLKEKKRQVFMLCHLVPLINDALTFWKQKHCFNIDTANFERTYVSPHDY
jgi:hypothetical protein